LDAIGALVIGTIENALLRAGFAIIAVLAVAIVCPAPVRIENDLARDLRAASLAGTVLPVDLGWFSVVFVPISTLDAKLNSAKASIFKRAVNGEISVSILSESLTEF
jgi:hypothetical protein